MIRITNVSAPGTLVVLGQVISIGETKEFEIGPGEWPMIHINAPEDPVEIMVPVPEPVVHPDDAEPGTDEQ